MIDTHSHIYEPDFSDDRELVIERAKAAGVEMILLPNINRESIPSLLSLCASHPGYCYPMLGLHPTDVDPDTFREDLSLMRSLLDDPAHPYIAVGEVGLDLYWDQSHLAEQLEAFRTQIEWAIAFRLPLMIHARSAHRELVSVMDEYRDAQLTGVFHCFGGTVDEALELLAYPGFVLGIGGVLTYKKSTLPEVLSHVPLERIVLETDAPYLAPVPYRGKRNESAYVAETLKKVAYIYNVEPSTVESITNSTVRSLFSRIRAPY